MCGPIILVPHGFDYINVLDVRHPYKRLTYGGRIWCQQICRPRINPKCWFVLIILKILRVNFYIRPTEALDLGKYGITVNAYAPG